MADKKISLTPSPRPVRQIVRRILTVDELRQAALSHEDFIFSRRGGQRMHYSNRDLANLDLSGLNLQGAVFTGSAFANANLVNTILNSSILFGCDLSDANMQGASLRDADLRGAFFRRTNLAGANLSGADMREGRLAHGDREKGFREVIHDEVGAADLEGANMTGANLSLARLAATSADRADFTDANMRGCKLPRANLKRAILKGANLSHADLTGTTMRGANLRYAILIGASMDQCDTSEADMTGVLTDATMGRPLEALSRPIDQLLADHDRFVRSGGAEGRPLDLSGYDLRKAPNLTRFSMATIKAQGTVFYGLDLQNVRLQAAQLEGADLRACRLAGADLRGANLSEALLSQADLRDCDFSAILVREGVALPTKLIQAELRGADLRGANMGGASLRGADLTGARLEGALLDGVDFAHAVGVPEKVQTGKAIERGSSDMATVIGIDHDHYTDGYLRGILRQVRTIAMVGASPNWNRPSYFAMKYLQHKGYRVIPVNPTAAGQTILGEKTYAGLKDIPEPVDMVDIFRNSEAAGPITDDAVAIGTKVVWMQLGVRNDEAAHRAEAAGITVVMNRCPKIEYGRLHGELSWGGINSGIISAKRAKMRRL